MSRWRGRIVLGCIGLLILGFILIQLIPVWLLQGDPPVVREPQWNSPQTRALAQRACFDCHSNQTTWPWYSRVAPISWLITSDVLRGRRALNFSEWGVATTEGEGREGGGERGGRGAARVIEEGSMPPWYYIVLHPDAQLTDAEKQQLIQGMQASLNTSTP